MPAGMRQTTPAIDAAERLADAFDGLPTGVTRWKLAGALRMAARKLGLNASLLALLEHYIDLTYDIDWSPGNEPIICRPLIETAEHLGRSERQVRNMEAALMRLGLLVWRDSGNHHRKGRRDHRSNRLIYGYGPSLAPLGSRAASIIALAQQARSEQAETRRLRLAISALKRRIRSRMLAAEQEGHAMADIAAAFETLPPRNPAATPVESLQAQRDRLAAISETLSDMTGDDDQHDLQREIAGKAEIPAATHHQQAHKKLINEYHNRPPHPIDDPQQHAAERRISHRLVLKAMPSNLAIETKGSSHETIHQMIDRMPDHLMLYDVSNDDWGFACQRIGRVGAAICGIITVDAVEKRQRTTGNPIRAPRAYFRSLVRYHENDTLNYNNSLHRIAREREAPVTNRQQPGHYRQIETG
jgi:hypothetical protein